jgi:hypothetical protein
MTTSSFIDALEHELRAASRRRVRLALARVPRAPAGAAAAAVALAICAAVAVPLLQTHSQSSAGQAANMNGQTPPAAHSGRSSIVPVRNVLAGDRIGRAIFGESPATVVRRLDALLGRAPSNPYHATGAGGGVDHEIRWPGLEVFFGRGRFVGYSYGEPKQASGEPVLATRKGLRVGDPVADGERLYGQAFRVSAEQGGAWSVNTPHGRLLGFTSDVTNPKGKVLTIEAGHVGGPALTP